MPQLRTHYDNLKVARDAPSEVIRAAYKSLSQKYHPDRNPGDPDAARIMAIINGAYDVLSDPNKRRQHDEWIRRAEAELQGAPRPRTQPQPAPPAASSPPQPEFNLVDHFSQYWVAYALLSFLAWFFFEGSSPTMRSPGPPVVTPAANTLISVPPTPSTPVARPAYVRPSLAPNGQSWPPTSAYVSGYQRLNTNGLSSVTVDNTQNDSDVFGKLVYLGTQQPLAVRVFFIPQRSQFRLSNVRAGSYDIRYQDLESGVMSKSEPFELEEIQVAGGSEYSDMRLTLYKVRDGNMKMQTIGEKEF